MTAVLDEARELVNALGENEAPARGPVPLETALGLWLLPALPLLALLGFLMRRRDAEERRG